MRRPSLAACVAALVIVAGWGLTRRLVAAEPGAVDRAFQDFWGAADQAGSVKRVDGVVKSGVSFEEALTRLGRGRDYSPDAPRGQQNGRHRLDGIEHTYTILVPQNYDASRPYQLRVQLHGGANRTDPPDAARLGIDRLPGMSKHFRRTRRVA